MQAVPGIGHGVMRSIDMAKDSKVTRLVNSGIIVIDRQVQLISDLAQIDIESMADVEQKGLVLVFSQHVQFEHDVVFNEKRLEEISDQMLEELIFVIDRGGIFRVQKYFRKRKAFEGWYNITPKEAKALFIE